MALTVTLVAVQLPRAGPDHSRPASDMSKENAPLDSLALGHVRRIAQSSMPFKQMENISTYVEACTKLGVPAQDLFMTVDLFEAKDMRAVVRNIHSLGRVAQTIGTFGGPHLGAKLAAKNERHFSEAQLAEARAMPARWTNLGKTLPPSSANPMAPASGFASGRPSVSPSASPSSLAPASGRPSVSPSASPVAGSADTHAVTHVETAQEDAPSSRTRI